MRKQRVGRRVAGLLGAVALGVSSIVVGSAMWSPTSLALPGASEATVVAVNPTRVLDTRADVGLAGPFRAQVSRKLQITGTIVTFDEATNTRANRVVVSAGSTGVILNVTAVLPSSQGVISVRPGDASGVPSTSNINLLAGEIVPNAVTVNLPVAGGNAGDVDITYFGAPSGATVDVVVDVVGYTTSSGLADLVARVQTLESSGVVGAAGPVGPPARPARAVPPDRPERPDRAVPPDRPEPPGRRVLPERPGRRVPPARRAPISTTGRSSSTVTAPTRRTVRRSRTRCPPPPSPRLPIRGRSGSSPVCTTSEPAT